MHPPEHLLIVLHHLKDPSTACKKVNISSIEAIPDFRPFFTIERSALLHEVPVGIVLVTVAFEQAHIAKIRESFMVFTDSNHFPKAAI